MQTGITPIERDAIQNLPVGLRKFVQAKDGPKIIDLKPQDAEKLILDLIMETQMNTGHTKVAEDETINAVAAGSIYEYIKDRFNTLTIKELKLAILNGSIGEYGDYIGINLKSVSGWLKSYSASELKKKAMSEWNKYIELVQMPKYSDEKKEQIIISGCLRFWNDYKNAGLIKNLIIPVDKVCAIYYDYLVGKGIINFNKEQLKVFSNQAKIAYEAELSQAKLSRQIKKSDYDILMELVTNDKSDHLKNKRRKLAIMAYFDELISSGKDLNELLTNH